MQYQAKGANNEPEEQPARDSYRGRGGRGGRGGFKPQYQQKQYQPKQEEEKWRDYPQNAKTEYNQNKFGGYYKDQQPPPSRGGYNPRGSYQRAGYHNDQQRDQYDERQYPQNDPYYDEEEPYYPQHEQDYDKYARQYPQPSDNRREDRSEHKNYRTVMCKYFKMYGKCNYGDKCNFSHEEQVQQPTRYDDRRDERGYDERRDDRGYGGYDDRQDYRKDDRYDNRYDPKYDRRDDPRDKYEQRDYYDQRGSSSRGARGRGGRGERGSRGAPRGRGGGGREENPYVGYKFYDDGHELSESDYNDYRRDLGPKLKNPNKQERKNSDYYTDQKPADVYSDDSQEQVNKVWEAKPKEKPRYQYEEKPKYTEKPKYSEERSKYSEEKPRYSEDRYEKPKYAEKYADKPKYSDSKSKYQEPKYPEEKSKFSEEDVDEPYDYGNEKQDYDDYGEDGDFKYDEKDYDLDDLDAYTEDKDYDSTTVSYNSGNNQISRKYYAMGQQSDFIKSPCVVMMVAEKPSIAQSITEALCGKNFDKKTGPAKGIPIYTFKGHFKGHSANFKVTSVAGHVYNRDFPKEYQNRTKDPVILFDAPTIRNCDGRARPVAKHLQMCSNNIDFMVLWLDCDKEGENICFEVLDICKKNIAKSKKVQRVYRAKFSSIANKDIVTAFESLKYEPNYNEAISVDARQVLDLKIGVAFSRFQTNKLVNSIKRAGVRMLTYGPCQTPTLGFCVDQSEKIKKFVPETYWRIQAEIIDDRKSYTVKWCRGKIFDKMAITAIHMRLQLHPDVNDAEVLSVKKTTVKQQRPQGLNTVKLLKVGSQNFGISAHDTMKIAERLYLRGFTTYPRTESTTFSPNFNFKEVLNSLKDHDDYGKCARELLKDGFQKPRKGVDAGDHPPITPVRSAGESELHGIELKIYEYITSNFLACISRDATYQSIRTELQIGDEKFKMKGQILLDPGFLDVQPWQIHSDKEVPLFEVGDIIDVKSTKIAEGRTDSPGYLTEAELITKMEEHGIGTDASIPTHISNIIERNYVVVKEPGRSLVPTQLGQALVKGYCEIDPELVMPQVRSNIEKSCELVAQGKADFNQVVNHVLKIFKDKFNYFKLSVGTMERLLNIMLNTQMAQQKGLCISTKIQMKEESKDEAINFCIKCFKGHICVNYHPKKGWGLKCDNCGFALRCCQGAARVKKVADEEKQCKECGSFAVYVYYKDLEHCPFPQGQETHTACILCDTWLRGTIKQQTKVQKLMTAAEVEEAERKKEERKKLKEEKKALQKDDPAISNKDPAKKKKKTTGKTAADLLTAEERMNEFMKKFSK